MKSIERRFNNYVSALPQVSSYTCFSLAIEDQSFSKAIVRRWFNRLVEKEDYRKKEKEELLKDLFTHLKTAEDDI